MPTDSVWAPFIGTGDKAIAREIASATYEELKAKRHASSTKTFPSSFPIEGVWPPNQE